MFAREDATKRRRVKKKTESTNCEIISKDKIKKRKRKNCYYQRKNLNIRVLIKFTLLTHIITYFVRLEMD